MNKEWFDDWEVTYTGEGGVIVRLPHSHTESIVKFRSIKKDARIKWLVDVINCALTELSKQQKQTRESVIEEIKNIMDEEGAKDIGDQLEAFTGKRFCVACGYDPEHQRKYLLSKLKQKTKE